MASKALLVEWFETMYTLADFNAYKCGKAGIPGALFMKINSHHITDVTETLFSVGKVPSSKRMFKLHYSCFLISVGSKRKLQKTGCFDHNSILSTVISKRCMVNDYSVLKYFMGFGSCSKLNNKSKGLAITKLIKYSSTAYSLSF